MRQYSKTRRKPIKPSQERSETQVLTGCNAERWKNKRKKKSPVEANQEPPVPTCTWPLCQYTVVCTANSGEPGRDHRS